MEVRSIEHDLRRREDPVDRADPRGGLYMRSIEQTAELRVNPAEQIHTVDWDSSDRSITSGFVLTKLIDHAWRSAKQHFP
jgi:hypothetical protein